jgi:hypothetical protein
MAPLCEEFLFRGVIQPVYETRGAGWGVFFVGFLFIAFHLSLLQGLSIIPLTLALGYVNFRTRSLPASILTHFGANFLAALVLTQGVFHTGIEKWISSVPAILAGLVVAFIALLALIRITGKPAGLQEATSAEIAAEEASHNKPSALVAENWPLFAALLVYLPLIGVEFIFSRSPELLEKLLPAEQPLIIEGAPWEKSQSWQYEIRNVADEVVGEGECKLVVTEPSATVTCRSQVKAYEVKRSTGYFSSSGGERTDSLDWLLADGRMISGASDLILSDGSYASDMSWQADTDRFIIRRQEHGKEETVTPLPFSQTPLSDNPELLVAPDYTWPWQLAGMRFAEGEASSIVRFSPYTWRNETADNGPAANREPVRIAGLEAVTTPAGKFTAWKVINNDETVWYDASSSTVVMFFNGIETWAIR